MTHNMDPVWQKAIEWTKPPFDEDTITQVKAMIEKGGDELEDAFYKNLEFGTGGMRGIMGPGTNRVNKYTLGMATQGLANYLKFKFQAAGDAGEISVAIAYDCRHNSPRFARIVADVFTANGIAVYLFESLRPTPELSFAIRQLKCQSGVVLTASHNPKEYNGYKVYWSDGAQLVPPHDKNVIDEVQKVAVADVKFDGNPELLHLLGEEMDRKFMEASVSHSLTDTGKDQVKIVFTSLHGTSIKLIPGTLGLAGFKNVRIVEEQAEPDGNFPTVESPNPEEPAALKMAIELADKTQADIVVGTDPDGDRIGVAVRNEKGEMELLNGNQTASVMTWYLIDQWQKHGKLTGSEFICETIVTTNLMKDIADEYGVETHFTLTGFKWIAEVIRKLEGEKKFIGGGEESFGYMVGDFVRDKDSVTSALIVCEIAAWAGANGSSFFNVLLDIYERFGLYYEELESLVKKGKKGAEEIAAVMHRLRHYPPSELGGLRVVQIDDVKTGISTSMVNRDKYELHLPKSNVLQFYLEDGTKVTARPSGTEPKIKFYFSTCTDMDDRNRYREYIAQLKEKFRLIKEDLEII